MRFEHYTQCVFTLLVVTSVAAVCADKVYKVKANKQSKHTDNSHSNAKLQKSCWLCLLNTHMSHKAYCACSFNVRSNHAPLNYREQEFKNNLQLTILTYL